MLKLDPKALGLAWGILWGAAVLAVAVGNLVSGSYGQSFLQLLASWYPGYHATHSIGAICLVTVYAFLDGLIGGWVFGWLYNLLVRPAAQREPSVEQLKHAQHLT